MNPFTVILVYTVSWWMIFFMALPIGMQAQNESEEGTTLGTPESAPHDPKLKIKAFWTSIIAAVFTAIYFVIVEFDLITLRPAELG